MAIVILPTLVVSFALGYVFRDTEFPVPDLGAFLADNEPKSVLTLALENYAIWGSVFSLAHFVLYVKPQRSLFHPFKLNPNYPPTSLILREIGRSVRGNINTSGGLAWSFYDIIVIFSRRDRPLTFE